jgi:hypothetical protein
VIKDGRVFCKPCAAEAYFNNAREITWPDMNWAPVKEDYQSISEHASEKSISGGDEQAVQ